MSTQDNQSESFEKKQSHETRETGGYGDRELQNIHEQILREKSEPQELTAPVPLLFLVLAAILFFWAGYYFASYSAGFRGDVFDHNIKLGSEVKKVEKPFDPIVHGKKIFSRICVQCHQIDGKGIPDVYPPLVGSPYLGGDGHRPATILLMGLQGPLTVLGQQYNGSMPNHSMLKDKDISAVLTYVRQEWGNKHPAVSEELVAEVRKALGDRKTQFTGPELLKLYPLE